MRRVNEVAASTLGVIIHQPNKNEFVRCGRYIGTRGESGGITTDIYAVFDNRNPGVRG